MDTRQRTIATLLTAALAGTVHPVLADDAANLTTEIQAMDANAVTRSHGVVTGKIAADFESFAGSNENATALVTGLRNSTEITLTQEGQPSATFTPPTKPMGYGNVSTSLALAKYQLAQQGITEPTPDQLATALNGGTITVDGKTMEYQGILQMRADGMGWGQIAQQLGTKLGPIVSGIKARNASIAAAPPSQKGTTTNGSSTSGASGSSTHPSAAGGHPSGNGSRSGIVTGVGAGAPGLSKSHGRGAVSTAGGAASAPGQGIVSASGQPAGAGTQGLGLGRGNGVATATGSASGGSAGSGGSNGKALGQFK